MGYEDLAKYIIENYGWISIVMVIIDAILVELVKIPVKMLTKKIENERMRKLANKSIILISFGLAFLINFLAALWFPDYVAYSSKFAMAEGALANVFYLLGEGVITLPQAKELAKGADSIAKSNTKEDSEKTAIDEFKNLIGK
jgi:uncharacterized membrane protein